jgi:hypothetical protein
MFDDQGPLASAIVCALAALGAPAAAGSADGFLERPQAVAGRRSRLRVNQMTLV